MHIGDFAGRRAIVTGCASGIGAVAAECLHDAGAQVLGFDRARPTFPLAKFIEIDLGDPSSIDRATDLADGIDILLNCAGLSPIQPPLAVLKVNFLGTRYFTERVIEHMPQGGSIVSVSSNGGLGWRKRLELLRPFLATTSFDDGLRWIEQGPAIDNAYSFSKEAITLWTLQQSAGWIERGIRINCTSPGAVTTPMLSEIETRVPSEAIDAVTMPIGRRSQPGEQAWPLLFLASDAASYINGVNLPVDGGFAAALALRSAE